MPELNKVLSLLHSGRKIGFGRATTPARAADEITGSVAGSRAGGAASEPRRELGAAAAGEVRAGPDDERQRDKLHYGVSSEHAGLHRKRQASFSPSDIYTGQQSQECRTAWGLLNLLIKRPMAKIKVEKPTKGRRKGAGKTWGERGVGGSESMRRRR
jgi:hypothetical protein